MAAIVWTIPPVDMCLHIQTARQRDGFTVGQLIDLEPGIAGKVLTFACTADRRPAAWLEVFRPGEASSKMELVALADLAELVHQKGGK